MTKAKINIIIDIILLVLMTALTGIGLLIKYVLVSGVERWAKYGKNVNLSFMGLDRHQWGSIHYAIGLILAGFIVLHIVLHWKLFVNIYKRIFINKRTRLYFTIVLLFLSILFVVFPFMINPVIGDSEWENGNHSVINHNNDKEKKTELHLEKLKKQDNNFVAKEKKVQKENIEPKQVQHQHKEYHKNENIEVKGSMTLAEVSIKYNVPSDYIKQKLELPMSTSSSERLGRLKRRYNFNMGDIEKIIDNYLKKGVSND